MSAKLRPNPFSQVTIRRLAGAPAELRVWSATRSRGATTRNYSRAMRPDFDRLCKIAALAGAPEGAAAAALSIEDYVVLAALGLWAPEHDLIDPILLETPVVATLARSWPAGGFALRGEAWLQNGSEPCGPVRDVPLGCLSASRPILWHRGSKLAPALPWWPDAACLAAIEAVKRDAPLHADMLPALHALADQGILVRRQAEPAARPYLRLDAQAGRDFFAREGFVDLGQVLPPGQVAAFRDYWRRLAPLELFQTQ